MADDSSNLESINFISELYPRAEEFLILRMAQQCERLREVQAQHEIVAADGTCINGHLCLASSPRPLIVVNPTDICTLLVQSFPVKFECQICFRVVNVPDNAEWNKHVQLDVRSYTCTYANCADSKPWQSVSYWSQHENSHNPPGVWVCQEPYKKKFHVRSRHVCLEVHISEDNLKKHLQGAHQFNQKQAKKIVGECHFTKTNLRGSQMLNLWVCKVEHISGLDPKKISDICLKGFVSSRHLETHFQTHEIRRNREAEDYHYAGKYSGVESCKLCGEQVEKERRIPHMTEHFRSNVRHYLQYARQGGQGQQLYQQGRKQNHKRRQQEDTSASHFPNAEPQKSNGVIVPISSLRRSRRRGCRERRPKCSPPQITHLTKRQRYICAHGERFETPECLRTHNQTTLDAGQMSLIVALPRSSAPHPTQLSADNDKSAKSKDRMETRNTLQKLFEWHNSLLDPPVEFDNVESVDNVKGKAVATGKAATIQFCEILKDYKRKGLEKMHLDLNLREQTLISNYSIHIVKVAIRSTLNTQNTQRLLAWYSSLPKPPNKVFGVSKMAVLAQICETLQYCLGFSTISQVQLSINCATQIISIGTQCAKLLQDNNEEAQMEDNGPEGIEYLIR